MGKSYTHGYPWYEMLKFKYYSQSLNSEQYFKKLSRTAYILPVIENIKYKLLAMNTI